MFAPALALLPCGGSVWHSPHHCMVYRGDRAVVWALAHESAFLCPMKCCPCLDVYATWSVLMHSLHDPPLVLAEERDLAMESHLAALGIWLVLPLRLWRERCWTCPLPHWGASLARGWRWCWRRPWCTVWGAPLT